MLGCSFYVVVVGIPMQWLRIMYMRDWYVHLTATSVSGVHSVSYVYTVLPFYDVKCLCSGGREATPTSISIFDSYDIKTLVI